MQASIQINNYDQAAKLVSDIINTMHQSILNKTPTISDAIAKDSILDWVWAFDDIYYIIHPRNVARLEDCLMNFRAVYGLDVIRSLMAYLCGQDIQYLNLLVCFSHKSYTDELISQLHFRIRRNYSIQEAYQIIGLGG